MTDSANQPTGPAPAKKYRYRESWLHACAHQMLNHIFLASHALDKDELIPRCRITCGYPTNGARTTTMGQCINRSASADETVEIIISMRIDDPLDVAAILAHELIHAIRPKARHGKDFRRMALRIGLCGKMTSTVPGPAFLKRIEPILLALGPYPHAAIRLGGVPEKKTNQNKTRRWLKALCEECRYTVRVTRDWVKSDGAPHCPHHGEMSIIE